ncbi:hypothetical protein SOV92_17735 [Pectobacterium brasiliense]|uniref:Uncharacterized protein n=1 Tax=Pectobacterium brasiliense TaxID=180957 RepID=A0AAW9H6H8_9GAMM|nr:hypothetical protein [Pectobacterium brasiliense]MDY4379644.1 hypothetical protein [Pectobacterium brasiliense]
MLVARAQLNLIRDLVARFKRRDSVMRPVTEYQSQYIAIIALLRSVGHVFEKVDCTDPERRLWSKKQWSSWKQKPIFKKFIEPTRNALLKEFQGGLQLSSSSFGPIAVVADPSVPDGVSCVAGFDALEFRDLLGRPVMTNLHDAIDFWDDCLKEAEAAFGICDKSK